MAKRKSPFAAVPVSLDMADPGPMPYPWQVTPGPEDNGAQGQPKPSQSECEDLINKFSSSGMGGAGDYGKGY